MTALLEIIDLFIAVFDVHDNFDLGQAYRHVQVKPTLTWTKSDPDYPDDLTRLPWRLQHWNLVGHWVKISLNQSQVFTGSFSANKYTISFILV